MQTRTDVLAKQFLKLGHEVRVLTQTPSDTRDSREYEVVRRPSIRELWQAIKWCDVFYHSHYVLRPLWPLLFMPRRWVAGVHVSMVGSNGAIPWKKRLKLQALRLARVIAPSQAIAKELPVSANVIPNPFADDVIAPQGSATRDTDIIFVGRLEERKGVHVLLDALGRLRRSALEPKVIIVGSGPSEASLKSRVEMLDLSQQVTFVGTRQGDELSQLYNKSSILVVPSICEEAFGIVALEGISCGCVVVASDAGGLPEAVGACGTTFTTGDDEALAVSLEMLLTDVEVMARYREQAEPHLQMHRPPVVAQRYLSVFSD